jgi:hypothetical protein
MLIEDVLISGALVHEEKLWTDGLTFHNLAIIIAAGLSSIAMLLSLFSIMNHATKYTKPCEQRQ